MGDAQANPPDDDDDDRPPYPTFTERIYQDDRAPSFTAAYRRLIWPLRGEFPSAITVKPAGGGVPAPFFNPETGEWHGIASQSITDKKVSSLEASLRTLDEWDRIWERHHMEHAEDARDMDVGADVCEFVAYGDLENDVRPFAAEPEREDGTWGWDERSDKEFLIRCCGQERPLGKQGLTLEVRAAPGNDFVTIRDYVGGEQLHLLWYPDMI
jgi:hypothetical protein